MQLCLSDLATITGGLPRFASMPPSAGDLVAINRVLLAAKAVQPGDLYWRLTGQPGDLELAFLQGAIGVVCQRSIEPWPGRFCLVVPDPLFALQCLIDALEPQESWESCQFTNGHSTADDAQKFSARSPELKVLQLWSEARVDIYPSTCERPANSPLARKCRRRAA